MPSQPLDWTGKTLGDGRFRITEKLGEGGMGFVYKAHDAMLNTTVVIKIPRRSAIEDPEFAARFAREQQALSRLQHPHIVSILFVGESEGFPFVVMQFLGGGDLKARQKAAGRGKIAPLPPEDLPNWLPGVAKALDYIHAERYIHRDVKPANILFDNHGFVFLSDFGVAKVLAETANADKLTGSGMVLGTPEYMAPELIMHNLFDGRVDQYALAVTVYEVLCGRTPFEGSKSESILVKQVTKKIPPLSEVNRAISPSLTMAVMRGLAKKPNERYANCAEFAQAVVSAISAPARAVPQPVPGRSSGTLPYAKLMESDVVEPVILEPPSPRETPTGKLGGSTKLHREPKTPPKLRRRSKDSTENQPRKNEEEFSRVAIVFEELSTTFFIGLGLIGLYVLGIWVWAIISAYLVAKEDVPPAAKPQQITSATAEASAADQPGAIAETSPQPINRASQLNGSIEQRRRAAVRRDLSKSAPVGTARPR